MVDEIADLEEARKKRQQPTENSVYACPDCGCGMFWLYVLGGVVCANCETEIEDLSVVKA